MGAIQIDWISSAELNNPMLEKFNTELIELQLQKERLLVYQTNAAPEVRIVENKIQTLVSNLVREYQDTLESLSERQVETTRSWRSSRRTMPSSLGCAGISR